MTLAGNQQNPPILWIERPTRRCWRRDGRGLWRIQSLFCLDSLSVYVHRLMQTAFDCRSGVHSLTTLTSLSVNESCRYRLTCHTRSTRYRQEQLACSVFISLIKYQLCHLARTHSTMGSSQKFALGCIKVFGEVLNFNTHCRILSSITVLTSLLLHKKFTWPDFGRVYYRYPPVQRYSGQWA